MTTNNIERERPHIDVENRPFWDACRDHRLLFQRCNDCGEAQFYPRYLCTACFSDSLSWEESRGEGVVYTFTELHVTFEPGWQDATPYVVALIDLDEGYRMMSNIVADDLSAIEIGARARVTFEDVDDELSVPLFELLP